MNQLYWDRWGIQRRNEKNIQNFGWKTLRKLLGDIDVVRA
jgi:hypothetical protein